MAASSLARRGLLQPRSRRLLAPLGDERLVDQVREGNQAAFEALYDRHHRAILSFCRHMLGSREEAEDAVQQTFVSAYNGLLANDREVHFKPWIYTIARNRCLSVLRARREHATEVPEVATAGLSEEVERRSDLRQLVADLGTLPEPQRAALVLSELGDLPHGDVARVLGCEVARVKSLVFQARSALIETRRARETPCEQIQEELATAHGGALRRAPLRRHLSGCPACTAFRDDVRRQRRMMAAILPVIPTAGLKGSALASVGIGGAGAGAGSASAGGAAAGAGGGAAIGGGGGGAAIGGAATAGVTGAAGGGLATLVSGGTAKVLVTAAITAGTAGAVGGTVAVTSGDRGPKPPAGADAKPDGAGAGRPGTGVGDAGDRAQPAPGHRNGQRGTPGRAAPAGGPNESKARREAGARRKGSARREHAVPGAGFGAGQETGSAEGPKKAKRKGSAKAKPRRHGAGKRRGAQGLGVGDRGERRAKLPKRVGGVLPGRRDDDDHDDLASEAAAILAGG